MKRVEVRVKCHFDAAHLLPGYKGKCAYLHGHRWVVEALCVADVKEDGIAIDFKAVKEHIDALDHSFLNDKFKNPTAENVALYLLEKIPFCREVVLWETPECSVKVTSP